MIENWSGRNAGKGRAGRGGPEEDGREPQLRGVTSRDRPNRARGFQPGAIVPRGDSPGSSRVRRESSCGQSFTWCRHGGAAAGVRLIREQWPRRQEELQPTRVIRYLSAESAGGALEKQHRGEVCRFACCSSPRSSRCRSGGATFRNEPVRLPGEMSTHREQRSVGGTKFSHQRSAVLKRLQVYHVYRSGYRRGRISGQPSV